jgi:CHAT domain-containing protein
MSIYQHIIFTFTLILFFTQIHTTLAFQNNYIHEIEIQKEEVENLANKGELDSAISKYAKIKDLALQANLGEEAIKIHGDIFELIVLREDYEFGAKLQAIDDWKETWGNSDINNATYYGGLAHLYAYYGDLDSMNKYHKLADSYFENHKHSYLQANLYNTLSFEMYFLEELNLAKVMIDKAENIVSKESINIPTINDRISLIYNELGEYKKAIKYAIKHISHLETKQNNILAKITAYSNLAGIYSSCDDYNNSLIYHKKTLRLQKNEYDNTTNSSLAITHNNLGSTYYFLSNYITAKKHFLISLNYLQKEEEITESMIQDYINNYIQLTNVYLNEEKIDSAEYYIIKAKALQKELPYRLAIACGTHASIYKAKKQYNLAKQEIKKALAEGLEIYGDKNDDVGGFLLDYASIFYEEENYTEALHYCQKSLEAISIDFSDENGVSNPKLEDVLYKNNLMSVIERKIKVMKAMQEAGETSFGIQEVYESARLATAALEDLNRSLKDKKSKQYWLNKEALPTFETAIRIAVKAYKKTGDTKYLNEAFQLSEHSKSMLMRESMQEANASTFGGVPPELVLKEQELREAIATANKKYLDARLMGDEEEEKKQGELIFKYKHQADVLKHTFEDKYPKYAALKYSSVVADISTIQKDLDASACLLEYFEGKMNIYIFAITKEDQDVLVVPKGAGYARKMFSLQNALSSALAASKDPVNAYNQFIELGQYFHKKFLSTPLIADKDRLIIIPDGQIGYLPFEVLLTQKVDLADQDESISFSELPYLIRDYKVNYNYSATLISAQRKNKNQAINGKILAMAPNYTGTSPDCRGDRELKVRAELLDLPGAIQEVDRLNDTYESLCFWGEDANEINFTKEAPNYGILHLAMHGLVNNEYTELSGLAFAETPNCTSDNFLYAYEIKQQTLQASMVVLSACQTGIGKYQKGEGVVSIGRSFMYAGSPSLLMTLWSLNDQSGAFLVDEFYNNINLGMEKDEAIRQAKLTYLDNADGSLATHPFLWAAFVQFGDYSPITIDKKSNTLWYIGGGIGALLLLGIGFSRKRKS